VLALLDQAQPDFSLRGKEQPWPAAWLWCAFAAALVFNVLPMAEETWRCVRG
jgi:hypothetical protein